MRRATSIKDALRFFLPLIFMTELNTISKSVINAFMTEILILDWRLFFPLPGAEPVYNAYRARGRAGN